MMMLVVVSEDETLWMNESSIVLGLLDISGGCIVWPHPFPPQSAMP